MSLSSTEHSMFDGYIYQVTNDINSLSYIGQTIRTPDVRFKQHIKDAYGRKDSFIFHQALRDIGYEHFSVQVVICIHDTNISLLKERLDSLEKYYIDNYHTKYPDGYNMTLGGQGIQPKVIKQYDYDGNLIHVFSSLEQASQELKVSPSNISHNCNGKTYGTQWGIFRFENDSFDKYPAIYRPDGAFGIVMYDYYGNMKKSYKSIADYAQEYHLTKTSGSRYLKHHTLVDYSYVLFRKDEPFNQEKIRFPKYKPVQQLSLDGTIVSYYRNASCAAIVSHSDASSIIKCCRKKKNKIGNYQYQYADEIDYISYVLSKEKEQCQNVS